MQKKKQLQDSINFLNSRPYRCNTAFGHTTLIDTKKQLKDIVYNEDDSKRDLNAGELKVMEFLIEGRYYSHTG